MTYPHAHQNSLNCTCITIRFHFTNEQRRIGVGSIRFRSYFFFLFFFLLLACLHQCVEHWRFFDICHRFSRMYYKSHCTRWIITFDQISMQTEAIISMRFECQYSVVKTFKIEIQFLPVAFRRNFVENWLNVHFSFHVIFCI